MTPVAEFGLSPRSKKEVRLMKITVIGCGHGAFAAAADLSARGHEITLYADKAHSEYFDAIRESRTIHLTGCGHDEDVRLAKVTNEITEALDGAELIMPVIAANAHESVARELATHLRDNDRILLVPGSTGGALVFARILREQSKARDLRIAEFHTLPYACRKFGGTGKKLTGVHILLEVKLLFVACHPAIYNDEMYRIAKELYPAAVLLRDVLETSLNNGNATTHPAPVVLNAGKIEYYGRHYHYEEGITPSVAKVIQQIDDERKSICRAYGYSELDIKDRLLMMGYTHDKSSVYDAIRSSTEVFLPLEGPNDLSGRYLTEDAPFSLVAMSEIGRQAGVKTDAMDAIITLASLLRSDNYRETGLTLKRLGIDGLDKVELREYLDTGCRN